MRQSDGMADVEASKAAVPRDVLVRVQPLALPRSTFGSRGIAGYRHARLAQALGPDHPATRAAWGRLAYYLGHVPQRHLATPEAVAWLRESRAITGYMNRGERRAARYHHAPEALTP